MSSDHTDHTEAVEATRPLHHYQLDQTSKATAAGRPLRLIPLVLGIIYLGAALVWGLYQLDVLRTADLSLVLPAVLVIAGGSGLIASVLSVRRGSA